MKKLIGLLLLVFPMMVLGAPTLKWVGCGITKKAFMADLAAAYEEKTGVKIELAGGGATKGIREVAAGTADIGGACRFKLPRREQTSESTAKLIPVAWDALVVIVHKDNPVESLTIEQLQAIYKGELTNWKSINGQDRPLKLMIRKGKISGVGRTLRKLVFRDFDAEFVSDLVYPSSGPLEKAVEQDIDAIAVTGISSARKRNVKITQLEGKDPSYENIKSGDYLLYRPLYLVVNLLGSTYSEVKKFAEFARSAEGQAVIRNNGVVPYQEGIHLIKQRIQQWRKVHDMKAATS